MANLLIKSKQANWPHIAFSKLTKHKDIKLLKEWIRANVDGKYLIKIIKETGMNGKLKTIATFVRFENIDDLMICKLTWYDYE